jgi:hydrogenase-4 component B
MMLWVVAAALTIALSGVPGLFLPRGGSAGERPACFLILLGAGCGLIGVAGGLGGWGGDSVTLPWSVPGGELALRLDPLSAVFLLPVLLVVACGAVYGLGYWPQREHPDNGRKFRLFFGLIGSALIIVLTARNAVLFLLAWEVMALSSYFLITTEGEKIEARRAGFIYLVATHTGTLALFAMFALLEQLSGAFTFPAAQSLAAGGGGAIFLLGLFGFGLKAGLMPLHIWLPGAHAAAPSHASALLSGVMIKTGIYGLVRLTSFFAYLPPWWGWSILLLGAVSGIFGVAFALAQHDIKRLLAYHSVENIGIIALGLGIALLGRSFELPALTLLGIAGALLHVINHGLFKSLLFLSAGSVIHATGSREIDHYGGLLKRQPWTGIFFLGGAVAISGLPPFNGFISEWLIYLGAFNAFTGESLTVHLAVLAVPALALIGGLALACFVKVFGIAFLGEPRSAEAARAHEAPLSMRLAMLPLLACCVWIGLLPMTVAPLLQQAALDWSGRTGEASLTAPLAPLAWVGGMGWGLILAVVLVGLWLQRRARGAPNTGSTWGCGYALPGPRMQYTASSFADFLVGLFHFGLRTERRGGEVTDVFPAPGHFHSNTPDSVLDRLLYPGCRGVARGFTWLRARVQNGLVAVYLLYVAMTLFVLLLLITTI